ncbi:MAG: FAD-dependent oxidoreductase, partial [Ktedonobacterales bacterium]
MTAEDGAARKPVASPDEARRIFNTPRSKSYDLIIIGGGSAGLSAAGLAVTLGGHVALLERDKLGGECLYTGCVPSKALLHIARTAALIRDARKQGLSAQLAPIDLGAVADAVQRAIDAVYVESDAPEHYAHMGVEVLIGEPRFVSSRAVSINGHTLSAKGFLIAAGSHPAIADMPGLREAGFLTNETIFA